MNGQAIGGRYETAQFHELEWWQNNQIDMSLEWDHYLENLSDVLDNVGHVAVAVDVGSGPIPFLCSPAVSCDRAIAVDPLIDEYAKIEWAEEQAICPFERATDIHDVESAVSDLTLCLNALDHASSPYELLRQCCRITKSGGCLIVTVDIGKPPDIMHPHTIDGPTLIRAICRHADQVKCVVSASWKFENMVLWYAGKVR